MSKNQINAIDFADSTTRQLLQMHKLCYSRKSNKDIKLNNPIGTRAAQHKASFTAIRYYG